MVLIPGSHNASVPMPRRKGWDDVPIREVIRGRPGTVLIFHQGVFHCGTTNQMEYDRHIQHLVYAPPWLIPSDRKGNDPEFLAHHSAAPVATG